MSVMFDYDQRAATKEYRDGYDRIFKCGEHTDKEESLEVMAIEVGSKDDILGKVGLTEKK